MKYASVTQLQLSIMLDYCIITTVGQDLQKQSKIEHVKPCLCLSTQVSNQSFIEDMEIFQPFSTL